ncbi:hypothetical protein LINPERPRIM_LOCUS25453 [Linum perenne]
MANQSSCRLGLASPSLETELPTTYWRRQIRAPADFEEHRHCTEEN